MPKKLLTLTLTDEDGTVLSTKRVFVRPGEEYMGQEYVWGIRGKELFRDALCRLGLWDDFMAQRLQRAGEEIT